MTVVKEIPHPLYAINRLLLFLIVPVLAILIPLFSGIITTSKYTWWQLLLSYMFFFLISFSVFQGNVIFLKNIRKNYERKKHNYFSVVVSYFLVNIAYSAIVSALLIYVWQLISKEDDFSATKLFNASAMVVVAVIVINNLYELLLLRNETEETLSKARVMEIAKMQAELEALKAQIDPHFIFNSLNTLSFLISNKPETAKLYNETLARVYRYIIIHKDEDLIFLKEELEFISNYFYLLKIRHGKAIQMTIEIPDVKAENYLITPISLQILVENVIKHNFFTPEEPITINVSIQPNFVSVKNKIRAKEYVETSPGTGLNNLKNRYHIITQKHITVMKENDEFIVNVPILKS
jgi:LytS/YehU family sensor histidine kinase